MSTKKVGKKVTILLKNAAAAGMAKDVLKSAGFDTAAAKDADKAKRRAGRTGFILTDGATWGDLTKAKPESVLEEYFHVNLDLLCVADTSGRFLHLNPEWEKILGFSLRELLQVNFLTLVHPDDREKTLEAIGNLKAQREVTGFTNRYRTKDGEYRWLEWRSYPSGDIIYAAARDVTERILLERELRKSEEKYRLIVNNVSELVVKVDNEGRFLFVSPSYCTTFGRSEAELLGKTFLPLVYEEDRAATLEAMKALYAPPYRAYVEQRAMTVHGWRWIAWSDTAILDEKGGVREIIGVGRDITERKTTEEALEAAVKEKQALLKELQHRVKNTLAIIASLASLEEMRVEDPAMKDFIAGFKGRINSLALLYEMLYRTGETRSVELGSYFAGIVHSIRDSLVNREDRITIRTFCDEVVMGVKQATQLGLIVNETLTNALKYAFPGDRRGTIELILKNADSRIEVAIEDDGIGMPPGFDPKNSSGMGFQLVRSLAEQMGGSSEIKSGPGGTRVKLDLPKPL